MTELFELEWMGGVAEHHYRKARPGVDDFEWHTLDGSQYAPEVQAAARQVWTNLALSEYAAITSFAEVVAALSRARAPLDLIGMTSDFLADEVRHVELASRVVMQFGGALPRAFEPGRLAPALPSELTPLQRANELALRVGVVAEAFAGRTAAKILRAVTHPLLREVYISILRDEARHRRFGSLYFEWAGERLDDVERARLGNVAVRALADYRPQWASRNADASAIPPSQANELGWLERERYAPMVLEVVRTEIVPELRALELLLPEAELAQLLEA